MQRLSTMAGLMGLVAGLCSCAADVPGGPTGDLNPGGGGGGPTGDLNPGGGGGGGGGGTSDPNPGGPGPVDPADPEACSAIEVRAAPLTRPADIIWVIDNSGSMELEEARVQNNINAFAQDIAASGVDYHVVVITNADHVRVPAPLGGSDRLQVVDQEVDSHDALELVLSTYPQWRSFLRPGAIRHIVVVSDDESDMSQQDFERQISTLNDPGFPDGFVFHAVVAEAPAWDWNSHCFVIAAAIGATYISLQEDHDGVFYSLCDSDWTPLFDALSGTVAELSQLPCAFEIPEPPDGDAIDFGAVNFVYTAQGQDGVTIPYVGAGGDCGAADGWYYDDPAAPAEILACPATCDRLIADAGEVEVALGCATLLE